MLKGFLERVRQLGITEADFIRRTGLSYTTIYKLNLGRPAKPVTIARVQRVLAAIEAEVEAHPYIVPPKSVDQGGAA